MKGVENMSNKYPFCAWGIDQYLYAVDDSAQKMINRRDLDNFHFVQWPFSASPVAPLRWYVSTGRMPTPSLKTLLSVRPDVIARLLLKGGTDEEVVSRIMAKLEAYQQKGE